MTVDTVRRVTVPASGVSPRRAAKLLAFLRKQNLAQWPPPPPTAQERRARWDAHVARFGLGPERVDTPWGPVTPWTISEFHPDPARRTTFYLGVGHPHRLNDSPVPLFLSATTLARYRRRGDDFPVRMNGAPWAGDSGAYAALILRADPEGHPWFAHPDEYAAMWTRFQEDVGPPDVIGIQDWPCEPQCLRRTGATVREHQEATLANYLYLAEQFPHVPWLPTLQGWHPWEYVEHHRMYQAAGVDLAGMRVGVGSLCRRGSQREVARVLGTLAPLGMRMHGFGVSINALRLVGPLLASSDSQAWSATARRERIRLPGCTHLSRPDPLTGSRVPTDCRNCFRYALAYREEVMDALRYAARAMPTPSTPLVDLPPGPPLTSLGGRRRTSPRRSRSRAPYPDQLTLFDDPGGNTN
ncbi:hypothetical protein E0H26_26970 [Micromonospora zingiberis]|uniref:DeoxyPurine in DNA protein A domain-containing protein n=1 Tax=Micromonospora zingiberis TaxID=2053011 RepID=A0A4R0G576_9ACTN|nr:hypothetical protein [Micromonospora zingiberis]TCB90468.1 hypothetical protein E0H26_26970 [Micromonospora zingiberis]